MNPIVSLPRGAVVGMIHVAALPGTPRHQQAMAAIVAQATQEARVLTASGVDALLFENMHDVPYLYDQAGPEIVASMTAVGCAIRAVSSLPLGVQVLAGANAAALAVALAVRAQFVRAENFVFSHVADEGLMATASAGPLLRYRRQIGADSIAIFADIKKKHASHAITADVSLVETARGALFAGADELIVTGAATGTPTPPADLAAVHQATGRQAWVGSGLAPEQLPALWPHARGFIVGSWFKREGLWSNPLDPRRIETLVRAIRALRGETGAAPKATP